MRNIIIKILLWSLTKLKFDFYHPIAFHGSQYDNIASTIVNKWENTAPKNVTGEYKRHQVLAELKDLFPLANESELCAAIERAHFSL